MRGTAARVESTRASDLANAQAQIDVATFIQWADAYASGNPLLRDFYYERFRPEFKPAVLAWIATRPLQNPNAPLTPFAMPQYRLAAREQATALNKAADEASTQARTTMSRSVRTPTRRPSSTTGIEPKSPSRIVRAASHRISVELVLSTPGVITSATVVTPVPPDRNPSDSYPPRRT
jgi:hypothetical protein